MTKNSETSLKIKILISTFSLVVTLTLVEFGLRLMGEAVLDATQKEYIPPFDEKNSDNHDLTYEIYDSKIKNTSSVDPNSALCVGDSFTNGGNVQSYDTYPYFLYSIFNKNNTPLSIFNFGKCESSTFDSLDRIKEFIKEKKRKKETIPGKIILLTGSADLFGINFGQVNETKLEPFIVPLQSGLKSLRLYKIYRFFKYEFFKRFSLTNSLRIPYQPTTEAEKDSLKVIINNAIEEYKGKDIAYKYSKRLEKRLLKDVTIELTPAFRKEILPNEEFHGNIYIERVLIYYVGILSRKDQHKEAIDFLLNFISKNADFFWKENTINAVKYYFTQALLLQSKYTAHTIFNKLSKLAPSKPSGDYKRMIDLIKKWDKNMDILNTRRSQAWDEIYKLTKNEGIELILMNYPSNYQSANKVLKEVSLKYNLKFIDNNKVFQDLIKKHGKERYLYDDDHCTPEGYKIMAQNIYNIINRNKSE